MRASERGSRVLSREVRRETGLGGCTRVACTGAGKAVATDGWVLVMETFEGFTVWTEGGWGKPVAPLSR